MKLLKPIQAQDIESLIAKTTEPIYLSQNYQDRLKQILKTYTGVFTEELSKNPANIEPLQLKLIPGAICPKQRRRWMNPVTLDWIEQETKRLLDADIIQLSTSAWISPLHIVKASTNSANQGGHWKKLSVEESSRQYLAFSTHDRLYEFQRVPFGLHNAPGWFQLGNDVGNNSEIPH
eukprot:TRINITY_DN146160_c0_g1_i1.p1 TRINITY_DN146160_c0_g1~~TRINITY_DN146160_c0_g1_i1.p1  ORF type:complete len:177 (+),score=5.56 TRINITY_DN146160_c0_g1_i1:152-682(+)